MLGVCPGPQAVEKRWAQVHVTEHLNNGRARVGTGHAVGGRDQGAGSLSSAYVESQDVQVDGGLAGIR